MNNEKHTAGALSALRRIFVRWLKANPAATLEEKRAKAAHLGLV